MRRFALTNLRDFGMGKRACEDKIIEECDYLIEVFKKHKGKCFIFVKSVTFLFLFYLCYYNVLLFSHSKGEAFDTTQSVNYAVSNIICSIVYGNRFDYHDPRFTSMVDTTNKRIQLAGSPSIQVSMTIFVEPSAQ